MTQKSSFALVIPCYNEEKAIAIFSDEIIDLRQKWLEKFASIELNVIVVNNGSTDQSENLLRQHLAGLSYVSVINCLQRGYGAALKVGFAHGQADYYGFADLDNTYPLLDIIPMLTLVLKQKFDMVSGGRLNSQSKIPLTRMCGNLFYSLLARLFYKTQIQDTCSGLRVFSKNRRTEVLSLKQNDLSFSIELTAHAFKYRWSLYEYPIQYRERLGTSKLSIHTDGFKFLYILLLKRIFA